MAKPISLPLYEKLPLKNTVQRILDTTIFFLLLSLLAYRILSLHSNGFTFLLALFCESWFTIVWALILSSKWSPVEYRTYPERLLLRYLNYCLTSYIIRLFYSYFLKLFLKIVFRNTENTFWCWYSLKTVLVF